MIGYHTAADENRLYHKAIWKNIVEIPRLAAVGILQ